MLLRLARAALCAFALRAPTLEMRLRAAGSVCALDALSGARWGPQGGGSCEIVYRAPTHTHTHGALAKWANAACSALYQRNCNARCKRGESARRHAADSASGSSSEQASRQASKRSSANGAERALHAFQRTSSAAPANDCALLATTPLQLKLKLKLQPPHTPAASFIRAASCATAKRTTRRDAEEMELPKSGAPKGAGAAGGGDWARERHLR